MKYVKIGVRETTFGGGVPDLILFSKDGLKINAIYEERYMDCDSNLCRPNTEGYPWSYIHPSIRVGFLIEKALDDFCGQFERFNDEYREPFTVIETIEPDQIRIVGDIFTHTGIGWISEFTHTYELI